MERTGKTRKSMTFTRAKMAVNDPVSIVTTIWGEIIHKIRGRDQQTNGRTAHNSVDIPIDHVETGLSNELNSNAVDFK
jgi:hypothetical protein